MAVTVNIVAKKRNEIKRFLEKFYEKEINIDKDVDKWINVYQKPLESVDLITAIIDNNSEYQISLFIELDGGNLYYVTSDNYNDIIKGLYQLYYKEVVTN